MFPWSSAKRFAQQASGALDAARAYLQLEYDSGVDWEVDGEARRPIAHPHRRQLRGRFADRRPGQPAPAPHICLSPVGGTPYKAVPRSEGRRSAWRAKCNGGDTAHGSLC